MPLFTLMAALLVILIALAFSWMFVLVPVSRALAREEDRRFKLAYSLLQAHAVRKFHPAFRYHDELSQLSLREISERFDIKRSYEEIF